MRTNPVSWFEIYVQDMDRAKAFYEAVFEGTLTLLPSPMPEIEMWTFPSDYTASGASGALVKMEGKDPGNGGTLVYFKCEDCAVEGERVQANGGSLMREKTSIGDYGFFAFAYDTEGNLIGLHSME